MTPFLDELSRWLVIVACIMILPAMCIHMLFLYAMKEALEKVSEANRRMRPGQVWLNLIPLFNFAWMYVTVARVGESINAELAERDPDYQGDGGKLRGYIYATASFLSAIPPFAVVTGIPAIVFYILYWCKIAQYSRQLDVNHEGVFFERYNARLEFPNALALVTLFVATVFFVALVLKVSGRDSQAKAPPIRLVDGGDDDEGVGSPGSGQEVPVLGQKPVTREEMEQKLDKPLPEIQDQLKQQIALDDPTTAATLPEEKAAQYATFSDEIQKKLLNIGGKRGVGGSNGSGDTGQTGNGPGGIGADSTRARSLRWVLRFKTESGRDYLNQLKALNAVVVVPVGSDKSSAYVFKPHELDNPKPGNLVTEAEWKQLAQQIQFCDFKRDSTTAVGAALGLNFTPAAFWAFFPPELEKELAKKEVAYRNRRPEDVAETIFQVTVRGGQYELFVVEQRVKR